MNWIVPGKFLAFSSPASRRITPDGMVHLTPDDYYPIFKKWNITAVVRLNKKLYDRKQFINYNINHYDMYYIDGGLPPDPILVKFLEISTQEKGGIAVHCKAGLGRTGTLIGMYIMKHYRWTASEVIAWLRIVRPGSVIGIQQHYLKEMQPKMWKQGEEIFAKLLASNPSLASSLAALENSSKTSSTNNTQPGQPNGSTIALGLASPVTPSSPSSSSSLFSRNTSSLIPSPISTSKSGLPSSPSSGGYGLRSTGNRSGSLSQYGSSSPSGDVTSPTSSTRVNTSIGSTVGKPQKVVRPMTTTGLSRSIPVLTQGLQSTTLGEVTSNSSPSSYSKRLVNSANATSHKNYSTSTTLSSQMQDYEPSSFAVSGSTYARDTSSISINPSMGHIMASSSNSSLTPTSLRTSNLTGSNMSRTFGTNSTSIGSVSSTSKPIKKLHQLTEMNNKYVPNRQAKKNFLLKEEGQDVGISQNSDQSRGSNILGTRSSIRGQYGYDY
ncbi:hypothetical protein AKO1_009174 [Acrasis kona]|uniref:protein-tyrosine-phosphatase n=1 Tax=Acrasis kona TaxID=1008807 RepID=A0AAW2ZJ52_9EUKA